MRLISRFFTSRGTAHLIGHMKLEQMLLQFSEQHMPQEMKDSDAEEVKRVVEEARKKGAARKMLTIRDPSTGKILQACSAQKKTLMIRDPV